MSKHVEALKRVPEFATIYYRIQKVKLELDPEVDLKKRRMSP
ncbi:MAG: hypothetical protein QXG05_02880 [Nitrososphaerota archaeon]